MRLEQLAPGQEPVHLWAFREDVLVETAPGRDQIVVATRWGDLPVEDPDGLLREPLTRMTMGPMSMANMGTRPGPDVANDRFARLADRLAHSVVRSLGLDDGLPPLLSAVPITRDARFRPPSIGPAAPVRLSRFTAMRAVEDDLVLESPRSDYRVVLHRQPAACAAVALSGTTTVDELTGKLHCGRSVVGEIVVFLAATGMVVLGEPGGPSNDGPAVRYGEDEDPRLRPWSHHDLLFHSRSRLGQHDDPLGLTYAHTAETPPPVAKPPPPGTPTPLYRPELDELAGHDRTVTEVLESRPDPVGRAGAPTAEQIGELLYRSARIRSQRQLSGGGTSYPVSDRPYPSSSGSYDLEIYLVIDDCTGLPSGVCHYDPRRHALTTLDVAATEQTGLLELAQVGARISGRPPVLLMITTRIARVSWLYSGIAYATVLRHVGMLQQTLNMVATAMGLLTYAAPIGDTLAAGRTLCPDWPAEVGVGEFAVWAPGTGPPD